MKRLNRTWWSWRNYGWIWPVFPWRRKWQPTPVYLPGISHGWRSRAGYSPWGHKESDTTEQLHSLTHLPVFRVHQLVTSALQMGCGEAVFQKRISRISIRDFWLWDRKRHWLERTGVRQINSKESGVWPLRLRFSSVAQSCPTLCDPMNRSTPGLPVHHQLPEFTQTHVHRVSDAIQPSHPLLSPSPPAPNPSQHQSLFQWVNSSHEVAKVLEFQL